jgi:hypothetical protein
MGNALKRKNGTNLMSTGNVTAQVAKQTAVDNIEDALRIAVVLLNLSQPV